MILRYYFFKEGNREYDIAELMSYFEANKNISIVEKNEYEKVAHYVNDVLNFECSFVIASKSVVPGIERLDARYLDVNLRVEFDALLTNYQASIVFSMCENIAKMFGFAIYNEVLTGVSEFKKSLLMRSFEVIKEAYKTKYPDEIAKYVKIDVEQMNSVSEYIVNKDNILSTVNKGVIVPSIVYYRQVGKRQAYTCIHLKNDGDFVLPGFVDFVRITFGKIDEFISCQEFVQKNKKFLEIIDSSVRKLYISRQNTKKIYKTCANEKVILKNYSPLAIELTQIEDNKVLDI